MNSLSSPVEHKKLLGMRWKFLDERSVSNGLLAAAGEGTQLLLISKKDETLGNVGLQ